MKIFKIFAIAAFAILFQSCFNSDEHIFNESESTEIEIEATLARNSTDYSTIVKADTFHIGDTIYFLTSISPNKLIKVQDYHWLMDGKHCSSEFNFKKQINDPGHHKFTFVLKDYFGDMHYDSLDVWIADKPILNEKDFTPAEGTQTIDPNEAIYFTWSAKTNGIKLAHRFHFTLSEQSYANEKSKFNDIDTILNEPNFTFHNKLNSFKKYNWTVQAINEYNLVSEEKIESFFFTKGLPGDGSLQASIDIGNAHSVPVQLSLLNKKDSNKRFNFNFSISSTNKEISLGAIPAGSYQLSILSEQSDFGNYKKDINIHDGFVTIMKDVKLIDSIPPTIISLTGKDTISFADTLQFIVKDGSGQIDLQKTKVKLESEQILEKFYKDSLLTVVLKETDKSWAYRILVISATDGSQNTRTKSFYIEPTANWITANSDTTIASNGFVLFYIYDNNPYNFEVESFNLYNITKNEMIISLQEDSGRKSFKGDLEASLFAEEQTIESTIIYKNGLKQSKTWKLYVKQNSTTGEEQ